MWRCPACRRPSSATTQGQRGWQLTCHCKRGLYSQIRVRAQRSRLSLSLQGKGLAEAAPEAAFPRGP